MLNIKLNNHNRTILSILILLLGAGWIWVSAADSEEISSDEIAAPQAGFLAPDFQLETLEGETVSLSDFKGQVVLINLWASWCPPCRAEMPAMQSAYGRYREQGLAILAVNLINQDTLQDVTAFSKEHNLTFPILLDNQGQVARDYQAHLLPTSYFVDRRGVIRYKVIGAMSEALLRTRLEALLEEAP